MLRSSIHLADMPIANTPAGTDFSVRLSLASRTAVGLPHIHRWVGSRDVFRGLRGVHFAFRSGRALARAPQVTFPAPPLKFRTSGFPGYGFKHQAPQWSSVRCLPRHPPRLRLTQPYPWHHPAFAPPFGSTAPPFDLDGILGRRRALSPAMTCRLRHLSPEVLAPAGLCCPAHHRLIDLIRQSGGLRTISRTAVIGAVLDIRGSQHPVCPPDLPAFHC